MEWVVSLKCKEVKVHSLNRIGYKMKTPAVFDLPEFSFYVKVPRC